MIHLLLNTPPGATVGDLTDDQLIDMAAAGAPLIDIRRAPEWEETGVIEGSHLITFFEERNKYDLDAWLAAFDKVAGRDKPFILICRHGIRTRKLGRFLDGRQDFRYIHHLQHGITGWILADHPTERIDA
ncbi:MAG: rhodanese-like domain-containing protein [Candidatus Krumholzibacteria bacterium]|nr:rhodanese-like domain-containing protein [Candidatus Krumholzibacteria bacterium]